MRQIRRLLLLFLICFNWFNNQNAQETTVTPTEQTLLKRLSGNSLIQGICTATGEIIPGHYLFIIKNQLQTRTNHQSIECNPFKIYKQGFMTNWTYMNIVTPIQVGISSFISNILPMSKDMNAYVSAFSSGFLTGSIASPMENILLYQSEKKSFVHAFQYIYQHQGLKSLLRGFIPIANRDALFALAYMELAPYLSRNIKKYTESNTLCTLGAGISAGIFIAYLTHPFDTIGKKMQLDLHKNEYRSLFQSINQIQRNSGIKALFAGIHARTVRITFAVTIMSTIYNSMNTFSKS